MPVNCRKHEDVQKVILALLVSRKGATALPHLERDYYNEEGERIPWRQLGYSSLIEFLQSMPNQVYIENRDGVHYLCAQSDKSKHVSSLVARQKSNKKGTNPRRSFRPSHFFPRSTRSRIYIPSDTLAYVIDLIKKNPAGINKNRILEIVRDSLPHVRVSMMDLTEQLKEFYREIYMDENSVYPVIANNANVNSQNRAETISSSSTMSNKYTVAGADDFSSSECEYGGSNYQFVPSGYSKPFQKQAHNKKTSSFPKENVTECTRDDIISTKPIESNQEIRDRKGMEDTVNGNENIEDDAKRKSSFDNINALICDRTKFRLEKLIQKYPDGIWCADLPQKYLEEYNVNLNYTALGFISVREFVSYLPDIFHMEQLHETGDWKVYNVKNSRTSNVNKEKLTLASIYNVYTPEKVEPLPAVVSTETSKALIPEEVLSIGESVGQINVLELPTIQEAKPHIEVYVVDVFTPSFFWIQLRKNKKVLDKLMDDLNNFYNADGLKYQIPLIVLEKGLNCACKYNNIWHRAIIKNVRHDYRVTVMFYDYGTIKSYEANEIYYLHRKFSFLPAQAIAVGLINVKPYNGDMWSKQVTHEFAERTSQIPLIAMIAKVDEDNNSAMITLTDTSEEDDVHINDWMVAKKFAEYGKMVRMRPRNFAFRYDLEYRRCLERAKNAAPTCISNDLTNNKKLSNEGNSMLHDSHITRVKNEQNLSKILLHRSRTDNNINEKSDACLDTKEIVNDSFIESKPRATATIGLRSLYDQFKAYKASLSKRVPSDSNDTNNTTTKMDGTSSITATKTRNETQGVPLTRDKKKLFETMNESNNELNPGDNTVQLNSKKIETKTEYSKNDDDKFEVERSSGFIVNHRSMCMSSRNSDYDYANDERFFGKFDSLCGGQGNVKFNWSVIKNDHKQTKDHKQSLAHEDSKSEKKESETTTTGKIKVLAENSVFLNAVRLSCSSHAGTFWSPSGNIDVARDDSIFLPKMTKKFDKNVSVAISKKVLVALRNKISSSDNSTAIDPLVDSKDFDAFKRTSTEHGSTDVLSSSSNCRLNEKLTSFTRETDSSETVSSIDENFIDIHNKNFIGEKFEDKRFSENRDEQKQNCPIESLEMRSLKLTDTLKRILLEKIEAQTTVENEFERDELDSDDLSSPDEYRNDQSEIEPIKEISIKRFNNVSTSCNEKRSDNVVPVIVEEEIPTDISDDTSETNKYDEFSTSAKDTDANGSYELNESTDKNEFEDIGDTKETENKKSVEFVEKKHENNESVEKEPDLVEKVIRMEEKQQFEGSENEERCDNSKEPICINEKANIPVFCDIGLDSDDEEWDVYEGDFVQNFSQLLLRYRQASDESYNDKSDSGLKITEISESDENRINDVKNCNRRC